MAKEKIMVVDDEPDVLALVSAVLECEGFKVITAGSCKEALSKLKTKIPDLVLLDIMLPEMSGIEGCAKIRKMPKIKDLKIIFITALEQSDVDEEAIKKLRASDVIRKPFDNTDMISRVKKVLAAA